MMHEVEDVTIKAVRCCDDKDDHHVQDDDDISSRSDT
jgi:hypothetical protein